MNTNTFVGASLIGCLVLAMFVGFVIVPVDPVAANGWYSFAGFGMIIFGTWAGIKLIKLKSE